MIKLVSDLLQVGGFLWVLREPVFSSNKTDNNDIHAMLLKVALSTITLTYKGNNGARFVTPTIMTLFIICLSKLID